MGRIALGIEYDGAAVYGWQRQREVPSVQEHLEKALSTVANEPIEVQCAGRTDAGVHATGQVVHFNCDAPRSERAWTLGVNANLPNSVAVTWAKNVAEISTHVFQLPIAAIAMLSTTPKCAPPYSVRALPTFIAN